jgi:hypothetical protein
MRPLAALSAALCLTLALAPASAAQSIGLAAGYTKIPGRLGDTRSDHGLALRLGLDLTGGRRVRLALEAGYDRLNPLANRFRTDCVLPGGGTGPCDFDRRVRDHGLSLSLLTRIRANRAAVTPYLLIGIGVLSVRTHEWQEVRDAAGTLLPNFSVDGTYTDGAAQGHLGGGLIIRGGRLPFDFTLEGRATGLLHNYSGGPATDLGPTFVLGIRRGG